MATAHYTIHVPNEHRQVGLAAHHYLTNSPIRGIKAATLSFGAPHDSLTIVGDETPELDSHIKQTGSFIADVANVPLIDVIKNGKNVSHWPMRNPNYQPSPTAPPGPFSGPQATPLPSAGPIPRPGL